jgi:pyruvate dehydrogenase E1 component
VVPIVPDEARTFGMEGMFRQLGIYSSVGQLYEPVDHDQLMYYREDIRGQILEEGITEAGAMSFVDRGGDAYSERTACQMIPFFIYYSMFGFQRIGDLAWAAGDMQARGFLLGGTAGRTTLNGEGLQHQDGHSHILAATIPNCVSYDPTFGYELAVIIQDGMKRMFERQENVFYYITVMNENYATRPCRPASKRTSSRACTCSRKGRRQAPQVQLLGSAPSCARCWPPPSCCRKTGASRPTCGA